MNDSLKDLAMAALICRQRGLITMAEKPPRANAATIQIKGLVRDGNPNYNRDYQRALRIEYKKRGLTSRGEIPKVKRNSK